MIIGQWCSNAFIWYIRMQVRYLSKGISNLMVSTSSFYIIPEAEVIYYTTGQPGVQSHRLNPQQGINITLLPPSCYRAEMVPKEVKTTSLAHKTLTSDAGKWFKFLLP